MTEQSENTHFSAHIHTQFEAIWQVLERPLEGTTPLRIEQLVKLIPHRPAHTD